MLRKLRQPKHVNNQTNNCMAFLQKFTAVGIVKKFPASWSENSAIWPYIGPL